MSNTITNYNNSYTKHEIPNNDQIHQISDENKQNTSNSLIFNDQRAAILKDAEFFERPTTLASRQVTNRPQEARTTPCRYFHDFVNTAKSKINVFSRHIAMLPQLASDIMYAVTGNDP